MKKVVLLLLVGFLTQLLAQTPFTLSGLKGLSVLAEDKSGVKLPQEFLDNTLEKMMRDSLKKLHITYEPYGETVLGLMIQGNTVQKTKVLTLRLMIASQVIREGEHEPVFGLTYMMADAIEVDPKDRETLRSDVKESLEFLLSEFEDQYKIDQKD